MICATNCCQGGMSMSSELLTVKEAAEWLKTSRVQVRRMIQSGDLAAAKVGREYRIPLVCLIEYIESNLT